MDTQYFVIKKEQCQECNGTGVYEDARWIEFTAWFKKYREEKGQAPGVEEEMLWWEKRGFDRGDRPNEEHPCSDCEGTGIVESEISLADALHEIGVQDLISRGVDLMTPEQVSQWQGVRAWQETV